MEWIYLSPHLDDVALSCGGLIWEQTQAGNKVSIWTIFTGDPPIGPLSSIAQKLHKRWGRGRDAYEQRRREDIASCSLISASYRHFAFPECIYRQAGNDHFDQDRASSDSPGDHLFLYLSEESLFDPLHPADNELVGRLFSGLSRSLPTNVELVCPLAFGGHVDHSLTRVAAENLGRKLWYYADFPHVMKVLPQIQAIIQNGWQKTVFPISQPGLVAWQAAVAAHRSQISTFWPTLSDMRDALKSYLEIFEGVILWRPPHGA